MRVPLVRVPLVRVALVRLVLRMVMSVSELVATLPTFATGAFGATIATAGRARGAFAT